MLGTWKLAQAVGTEWCSAFDVIGKFLPLPFNMIFLSIPFTDFYSRASVRTAISAFTIGPLPRQYSTTTIVVQIRQIRPNHNPGLGPGRFDLL